MSLAIVHGAVCGAPWCCNGRSNFKNYDNHMHIMQRTLEGEYDVSLGQVCQYYKVCLAEDVQARRELGLALLVVTDVRRTVST